MTPSEYLEQLRSEAKERGNERFHHGLKIWVDEHSSIARFVEAYAEASRG